MDDKNLNQKNCAVFRCDNARVILGHLNGDVSRIKNVNMKIYVQY